MKKRILSCAMAALMMLTLFSGLTVSAQAATSSGIDPAAFAEPDFEYRPGVRWWWPGNAAKTEDLVAQVDYLADNGFGVVEIVAFTNGFLPSTGPETTATNSSVYHSMAGYDRAAILSYDTPEYYAKLEAVVKRCNERGIVVDLNMGSGYLASDDSVTIDDSQAHMALGRATITAANMDPISINVPAVEASTFYGFMAQGSRAGDWVPSKAHLCGVVVAEITSIATSTTNRNQILDFTNPDAPTITKRYTDTYTLDFDKSAYFEAYEVVGGKVTFTPSKVGNYEVVALYSIPTGSVALNAVRENAVGKRSYVVDHMNAEAVKNYIEGWIGDPGLTKIVNNYNVRAAFNDSYEFWMDRYFNDRIYALAKQEAGPNGLLGYDVSRFIASFYQPLANSFTMSGNGGSGAWFNSLKSATNPAYSSTGALYFSNSLGTAMNTRILYDYNQLINKAFQEGMKAFSDTLGQYDADGSGIKYRQQAYNPPIDTLKSSKYVDIPETEGETENSLRRVSSGAHLYGKNLVTCEVFTLGNVPFNVLPQKMKLGYDTMAVSGVNNFFYHGLNAPYYGSGTEIADGLFPEEGWRGWSTIGVEMNNTEAISPYYKTMNMYAARANFVMQSGKPSSDVALYMPLFGSVSTGSAYTTMNRNGLTFDAINDDTINDDLKWQGGKLTNGIISYSALIVNNTTVPVKTMQTLKALAAVGAPIIFYGTLPNAQPSYCGGNYAAQDALVGTLANEAVVAGATHIATAPSSGVSSELATKLLGFCKPAINCVQMDNDDVRLNRRTLPTGGELAYIRNSSTSTARTITLKVEPSLTNAYWLDQSNGKIYTAKLSNGSVTITLKPIGAIVLLCEPTGVIMPSSAVIQGLPASIEQYAVISSTALTNSDFTLTVTADNFNTSGGTTAGVVPGATVTRTFTGTILGSWVTSGFQSNALRYVSSPGIFTTKIQVDDLDVYAQNRMILDLGTVYYTATVIVNGITVGQLYVAPYQIDITNALKQGENEITVEVQPLKHNRRIGLYQAYNANKTTNKQYMYYAGNVSGTTPITAGLAGPVNLLKVVGRYNIDVEASIRANEAAVIINNPASYTVSLMNATGVGTVELSFIFNGYELDKDSITVTPQNGFALGIYPDLKFQYLGQGMWMGTVQYMYLADKFVNTNNPLDILKISGTAIDTGPATVTLTSITIKGDNGTGVGIMPSVIKADEATTAVGSKPAVYSKYDLNKDGSIDETDLLYLVYFYQWNDRDADWDTADLYGIFAKDCDFQVNGKVDLADMIELTANYGIYDPYA